MPGTITVTGTTGAGLTATAVQTLLASRIEMDLNNEMITVFSDGNSPRTFNIQACTTLTFTVVAPNNYTLTIS